MTDAAEEPTPDPPVATRRLLAVVAAVAVLTAAIVFLTQRGEGGVPELERSLARAVGRPAADVVCRTGGYFGAAGWRCDVGRGGRAVLYRVRRTTEDCWTAEQVGVGGRPVGAGAARGPRTADGCR